MNAGHDAAYRQLFAHSEIVRNLLEGFLPDGWATGMDLDTLQRVNGSYVSDDGSQRHSDMVWKIQLSGRWVYLYLLLEFQSQPDIWMALRVQVYVGLMYQDLIARHEIPAQGVLPPVLPVVLYSGKKRWRAKLSLGELIASPHEPLLWLQPEQKYLLIDVRRLARENGLPVKNLLASLWRLRYPSDLVERRQLLLEALDTVLNIDIPALKRTAEVWLRMSLPVDVRYPKLESTMKQGKQMFRYNMPDFETFREEYMWSMRQRGKQDMLTRQLRKRFGSIPADIQETLDTGGGAEFDVWMDRFSAGKSLARIFAPIEDDEWPADGAEY